MKVIYRIRNVVNQKFYVGSTTNPKVRFRTHRKKLRSNTHHCKHLQAAWNKYGGECFKFEVVEVLIGDSDLQAAEDVWLTEHVGEKNCYNAGVRSGAPWRGVYGAQHPSFGKPVSAEQKADISRTLKEFYAAAPENHPRWGKSHTEESKAKIRAARKGKMSGVEHYRYGTTLSKEVREKIGAAQRGKPKAPRVITPEGRAKIKAAAAAGHYASFTGKKHTEEAKRLMSKRVICITDNLEFDSVSAALAHYGLKMPTLRRALKTEHPIQKGRLAGYIFRYGGLSMEQIKHKLNKAGKPLLDTVIVTGV